MIVPYDVYVEGVLMTDERNVTTMFYLLGEPSYFSWTRYTRSRSRYDNYIPGLNILKQTYVYLQKNKHSPTIVRPRIPRGAMAGKMFT